MALIIFGGLFITHGHKMRTIGELVFGIDGHKADHSDVISEAFAL